MKRNRNWIIGIVLTATVGFIALQNGIAPSQDEATQPPFVTNTSTIEITDTPTYEGCGYMWAYHNSPELTEKKIQLFAISTLTRVQEQSYLVKIASMQTEAVPSAQRKLISIYSFLLMI